ncbi:hypothetical protein R3P38DRAFT_3210741 [Favolaschia claudopus]|uniref:Uncharacterized protein n=1 Tax=Favolaschia claudopus TaxID=2862362 RepID=A0AAW0AHD5_9AGAR
MPDATPKGSHVFRPHTALAHPASTSRKRKPADSNAGTLKKPCLSGGAAALSIDIAPSPVRLKNAVKRARELETWMEKVDLVSFFDVLMNIYDTFEDCDEELRIIWVKRKVGIEA